MRFDDFSPQQKRAMTWWMPRSPDRQYDAIICDGAVRSGKTLCMGLGFFLWACACFDGQRFALCGRSVGAIRRNLLAEVLPRLGKLGFGLDEHRAEQRLHVRFGGRENDFYLFGAADERAAARIQGATFAGVLLDEAALMPRSFVEQACARCSVSGSRLWFNCNPEHPGHWFYREWIQCAAQRGALYLHFTMDDNPSLSPRIRARYARMYTGAFYRRFVLGEWVAAEGRVYPFIDPERAPPPPTDGFDEWRISCDYGTVNPASFGLWGRRAGVWYRIKEFYFDSRRAGRQMTDAEYVQALRELAGGRAICAVIVDPSAASFCEALRRAGFRVRRADNDVLSGIRTAADLLKSGRVVVCSTCPDCLREFTLYSWDSTGSRDAVRKVNDHAMDDLRYFCMDIRGGGEPFAVVSVRRKAGESFHEVTR